MLLTAEPLTGERLLLEPLRVEHAAEMVAVLADLALYTFTGGEPPTETNLIERYRRQSSRPGWLNWVLRARDSGEAVGTVQATQRDERTRITRPRTPWPPASALCPPAPSRTARRAGNSISAATIE